MTELSANLMNEVIVPLLQANVDVLQVRASKIEAHIEDWTVWHLDGFELLVICRDQRERAQLAASAARAMERRVVGKWTPIKITSNELWYRRTTNATVVVKITLLERTDEHPLGVSPNKCMLVLGDDEQPLDPAPFIEALEVHETERALQELSVV